MARRCAHAHNANLLVLSPELAEQRCGLTSSRRASRMAQRYRTTIGVHSVFVQSKLPDARDSLAGKSLIQLDNVDVLESDASVIEQSGYGVYRTYAHLVWCTTFDLSANKTTKWLETTFFGP